MLVEDDALLSNFMVEVILLLNCKVLGPFSRIEEGMIYAAESQMDMAILDVNIPGGSSKPIALILQLRNIPFFFTSGDMEANIEGFEDVFVLPKPSNLETIENTIKQTLYSSKKRLCSA
jgi:DNA-binding response OmpR family regulator